LEHFKTLQARVYKVQFLGKFYMLHASSSTEIIQHQWKMWSWKRWYKIGHILF